MSDGNSEFDRGRGAGAGAMSRRAMLRRLAWAGLAGAGRGLASDAGAPADGPGARELLRDPAFQRGFRLCDPTPGRRVPYGNLEGFVPGPPSWDLDQWSSRFRLEPAAPSPVAGAEDVRRWSNTAKSVAVTRSRVGQPAELELAVNAGTEYGSRARQAVDPWVHLLVEQEIPGSPTLAALRRARFRIEAQLRRSILHRTEDYSPDRHAAQFQVFLTVQNMNRASAGSGRLLWFGIPLYDDRHRTPPEHKTRDTGGTDMFIFTPAGREYTRASAHDRAWITVDDDLVPRFREALETAWSKGFLTESRRLEDYRLTTINLGWEVPGMFDVTLAVRGLGLTVEI